jgi:hypothetical protein
MRGTASLQVSREGSRPVFELHEHFFVLWVACTRGAYDTAPIMTCAGPCHRYPIVAVRVPPRQLQVLRESQPAPGRPAVPNIMENEAGPADQLAYPVL